MEYAAFSSPEIILLGSKNPLNIKHRLQYMHKVSWSIASILKDTIWREKQIFLSKKNLHADGNEITERYREALKKKYIYI